MKEYLFVEKYRPKTLEDLILPSDLKNVFKSILNKGELTNMIFYGSPGVGKTSLAKILAETLGFEMLFINGKNCVIDFLRYGLPQFASNLSFDSKKKLVVIDEAEKMTTDFANGLLSFIEEFHKNCTFILTTNFPSSFLPSFDSRFNKISFDYKNKEEKKEVFVEFLESVYNILDKENIKYDKKVVMNFIFPYFPDLRQALNNLQLISLEGEINISVLSKKNLDFTNLIRILKEKKFMEMYEYITENEIEFSNIIEEFMKNFSLFEPSNLPILIKLLNEHQYKHAFAIDKKVNLVDFLTNVMIEVKIK